ncbi:hypothetical protein cypCar_00017976, partial [Cyprinus carpio]
LILDVAHFSLSLALSLSLSFSLLHPCVGETLLHRACKRNQVETLLRILSVPGTDVNIKDHAGWTPLHEACNHGSTECVKALLQHCPNLQLGSQVQGVSPLHDALLNQHTHIAEMLLRRGGECPTYTYIHSEIRPSQNNTYIHTLNA